MGVRKRFRDFRDWCPQPPDRLPEKLKRYSMPIAAAFTVTLILSASFFVFSSSLVSPPIVPLVNVQGSTVATSLWNFTANQDTVISPVVANGFVYASSENVLGSAVTLFCINASTGAQAWNTTGQFLTFTVANGYVYLGQAIGFPIPEPTLPLAQGTISCLNASTGSQLWSYSYGTQVGTPVVDGGIVYIHETNFIFALNALTGAEIWNFSAPLETSFTGVVLAGAKLYAFSAFFSEENASWHSAVYALAASSGEELWNYSTPGQFSSLVAAGQNVYVSSTFTSTANELYTENIFGNTYQGGVLALNASNGTIIWNYPINSSFESPIVSNGTVYVVFGNGTINALYASDGKVSWKYETDLSAGNSLLVNGYLFVGTSEGVYCFNSYNGAVIWRFSANDFAGSSATNPAYADGTIYVGWNGPVLYSPVIYHNFYAIEASNGKTIWNYTIGYTVTAPASIADGTVYIGASYADPNTDEVYEMPGKVIALTSDVTSLPLPTLPISEPNHSQLSTTAAAIIATAIALILIATAFFVRRKPKTKTTSTLPLIDEVKE